jgi:ketosteroid isomerase-like protein
MHEHELRAEAACQRLVVAYGWAFDTLDVERFIALFCADAEWQRPSGERVVGHAALRESFVRRNPAVMLRHVCSNLLVTVLGEREAEGLSLSTVYRSTRLEGQAAELGLPLQIVEYRDRYRLDGDGRWRIAVRHTAIVLLNRTPSP